MSNLLFKNFSWNFSGSLIYAMSQWFLLIIITKIGSPYYAGIYSLGLAFSAPLIMFINLNFRALQSTDLSLIYGFRSFKSARLIGIISFSILFLLIVFFSDYEFEIVIVLILIALNKIVESYSDLYYGLFQFNERLDLVSISTIIRGVIGTAFFGIGYYFFGKIEIALIFMLFIWILNLVVFDLKNSKQFLSTNPEPNVAGRVKNLIKIGLPLGIVSFIASLSVNIPRLAIESYMTIEDLGYFASVFYMVLIIGKFMTSLANAILPRMARLYQNGNKIAFIKILVSISVFLIVFSIIIIIISTFWGSEILQIAYGSEYAPYESLLVFIMIYGLFEYLGFVFEVALNAMKYYKFRLMVEITATSIMIITSIYFIPEMGLMGAAVSLIIFSVFKLLMLSFLFAKTFFMSKGSG